MQDRRINLTREKPIPLGVYRRHLPTDWYVAFKNTIAGPAWAAGKVVGLVLGQVEVWGNTEREVYQMLYSNRELDVRKMEDERLRKEKEERAAYYAD